MPHSVKHPNLVESRLYGYRDCDIGNVTGWLLTHGVLYLRFRTRAWCVLGLVLRKLSYVNTEEFMSTQVEENVEQSVGTGSKTRTPISMSLNANWRVLTGVLVVAAVAVGAYVWYSSMQTAKNDEANVALARVKALFVNGDLDKALSGEGLPMIDNQATPGLQAIADMYGDVPAGQIASLMTGSILVNRSQVDEARAYFENALGSKSTDVKSGALAGLAACFEHEGQFSEAAQRYEEAAQVADNSGLEDRHWLHAGVSYEKAGNSEKAVAAYTIVVKKFGQSEAAASANLGLARLGTTID